MTSRELVELYVWKMGEPARAAPLLTRTAEEQAGTTEGEGAAEEDPSITPPSAACCA